ncbi:TetR family transcriptional regulator [Allorhizobium sp. BGMRC 0089]|nr:TetR family transcriptional regulator [Allorhizobium sonneratiae]
MTAEQLLAEHGFIHLKMTDIATNAGIPVGSLYQFFPEKAAIMKALIEHHLNLMIEYIKIRLQAIRNADEAHREVASLIVQGAVLHRRNPVYRELWIAASSDPELRHIRQDYQEKISQTAFKFLEPFLVQEEDAAKHRRLCLVTMLTGSVFRSVSDAEDDSRLIEDWKIIACDMLFRASPAPIGQS